MPNFGTATSYMLALSKTPPPAASAVMPAGGSPVGKNEVLELVPVSVIR